MRRALLLLLIVVAAGCTSPANPVPTPTGSTPDVTPTPTGPAPVQGPLLFDGQRAWDLAEAQVLYANGTVRHRVPNTTGNAEVAALIADTLRTNGWNASYQHFNATYGCAPTPMHNVVGERAGNSGRTVIVAAHYDTRPIAEKDRDPANRSRPIPGALDGAGGVAVLLELSRVLPPLRDTVRLVFFDGEDGGDYLGCTQWILGSTHYAKAMTRDEVNATKAFVLVDLVGDKDMRLPWEAASRRSAPAVQDRIWGIANSLGHKQFVNESGFGVVDDHTPFVERGIRALDIIHTDPRTFFPFWHHTQQDSLENLHADSLAAVGRTLELWLREDAG